MEKTIKYYNNRPVFVIRKEPDADFYQVLVNLEIKDIDLDFISESYRGCDSCMVGHKSECHCQDKVNEAYDLLERIVQENKIDEEALFWVRSKELRDKPFEWSENQKLKSEIAVKKRVLDGLIDILAENKSLIKAQENTLSSNNDEMIRMASIVDNRKSLTDIIIKDYDKLKKDIEDLESRKKLVVVDSEVKIEYSEYEHLLKREELLTALENGGVDNWEWYSEATKNL